MHIYVYMLPAGLLRWGQPFFLQRQAWKMRVCGIWLCEVLSTEFLSRPARGRSSGLGRFAPTHCEQHLPLGNIGVHHYVIAMQDPALKDFQRHWILDEALDSALQRPCAVGAVIAFQEQQLFGRWRKLNGDLAIGKKFA